MSELDHRFRRGHDDLGLRRALPGRLLPALVAAMAFLAALAAAGVVATAHLATQWQHGALAAVTIQVPRPGEPAADDAQDQTRRAAVQAVLAATPGVSVHQLDEGELADLLRPWLGDSAERLSLPLPAVFALHLADPDRDLAALTTRLDQAAPGTLVERHELWRGRLAALARSLQAAASLALLLVGGIAVAAITVATRAGLAARREAIELVHQIGAPDRFIAQRFAARASLLALIGGTIGALAALPVLLILAWLAAPLTGLTPRLATLALLLPPPLWASLLALPAAAAAIGWVTAQATVRGWLALLP